MILGIETDSLANRRGRDRQLRKQLDYRRRRSNRPGNSQAKGPRRDGALESGRANLGHRPTEDESRANIFPWRGQSFRY